jgi:hypothetical protein
MSTRRSLRTGLVGAAWLAALAIPANAATPVPKPSETRIARAAVQCEGAIQHPLSVRAEALDPVRRGSTVRVRVTTTARHETRRAEVRMTSTGGTVAAGATRATLGTLGAGRTATADFAVRVPSDGHRFLLQFRVTGEGASGLEARGGTLNLLPDGPADPGHPVMTSSGQSVVEYRARRIDR